MTKICHGTKYGHSPLLQFPEFISHPLDQTWWHMGSAKLDFEFFPSHHMSYVHGVNAVPPCSCISGQIVGGKKTFSLASTPATSKLFSMVCRQSSASRGSSDLV